MDGLSLNIIFADVDNNIGYAPAGAFPKRKQGDISGLRIQPGWVTTYDWEGYLKPEDKPYLFNPKKGYVASANN